MPAGLEIQIPGEAPQKISLIQHQFGFVAIEHIIGEITAAVDCVGKIMKGMTRNPCLPGIPQVGIHDQFNFGTQPGQPVPARFGSGRVVASIGVNRAELEMTITSLSEADQEFRSLFALGDRSEVLENLNETDMGDIDMKYLKKQINHTIDTVGEIRDYLSEARDLYMATPMGWPVEGWLSSKYGYRKHPVKKYRKLHSGLDVATRWSTTGRSSPIQ